MIGSASVAQVVGLKLLELGHEVMISSRNINQPKKYGGEMDFPSAKAWENENKSKGFKASAGTFKEAAKFGELVFNCTAGAHSIEALISAGEKELEGKILIDLANPLDFSKGMPPMLTICNTTSLGEQIQAKFSKTKVVKTLNTVTAELMINPGKVKGEHDLFMCGNDESAKKWVKSEILTKGFGWKIIHDLGAIKASRAMEMYLPLWVQLWNATKTPYFNIHLNEKV